VGATTTKRRTMVAAIIALVAVAAPAVVVFTTLVAKHPERQAIRTCEAWVVDQYDPGTTAKFSDENAYFDGIYPEARGWVGMRGPHGDQFGGDFICFMTERDGKWTVAFGDVITPPTAQSAVR